MSLRRSFRQSPLFPSQLPQGTLSPTAVEKVNSRRAPADSRLFRFWSWFVFVFGPVKRISFSRRYDDGWIRWRPNAHLHRLMQPRAHSPDEQRESEVQLGSVPRGVLCDVTQHHSCIVLVSIHQVAFDISKLSTFGVLLGSICCWGLHRGEGEEGDSESVDEEREWYRLGRAHTTPWHWEMRSDDKRAWSDFPIKFDGTDKACEAPELPSWFMTTSRSKSRSHSPFCR